MPEETTTSPIVVIAGAGPAGLTAAYEFTTRSAIRPIVYEASAAIGGISQTVHYHGNRIDIGGHRFFSKSERVMKWWRAIMPMQTAPALDEIILKERFAGGSLLPDAADTREADPQTADRVLLTRRRVSRIYYLRRFFDYPISMSMQTILNLGIGRTLKAGCSYMRAMMHKRKENSLEDFYINRFGKTLYSMFFEDYTEKVWGLHPSKLGADWGSQRVKGLSITAILKDMLLKKWGKQDASKVETSLIEEFIYPKYGPGQLWETVATDMVANGGKLEMQTAVKRIHISGNRVVGVTVVDNAGNETYAPCDYFISSMPIKDLVAALEGIDVPADVAQAAEALPYRDFITVGLLIDELKIKNKTRLHTYANRVPDTWIYVQERDVRMGRIQVFNNWSPYMVADYEHKMWIGLEYFCFEGDEMWMMSDADFIQMAVNELVHIDIIASAQDVEDAVRIKIKKAYPAYHGSYYQLDRVKTFLNSIENLYCIGRNGQHRYNNMDHSMLTAMNTVDAILNPTPDPTKSSIWNVNTETAYHESK
jgi:protoporphyrinogen oxidase